MYLCRSYALCWKCNSRSAREWRQKVKRKLGKIIFIVWFPLLPHPHEPLEKGEGQLVQRNWARIERNLMPKNRWREKNSLFLWLLFPLSLGLSSCDLLYFIVPLFSLFKQVFLSFCHWGGSLKLLGLRDTLIIHGQIRFFGRTQVWWVNEEMKMWYCSVSAMPVITGDNRCSVASRAVFSDAQSTTWSSGDHVD